MLIVPIADVWNDNYPLLKGMWLTSRHRVARTTSGDSSIPLASYPARHSYVSHSSHASGAESESPSRLSRSGYYSLNSS